MQRGKSVKMYLSKTKSSVKQDVMLHVLIFVALGRSNKLPLEIEYDYVLVICFIYGSLMLALGVYLIKFDLNLESEITPRSIYTKVFKKGFR